MKCRNCQKVFQIAEHATLASLEKDLQDDVTRAHIKCPSCNTRYEATLVIESITYQGALHVQAEGE